MERRGAGWDARSPRTGGRFRALRFASLVALSLAAVVLSGCTVIGGDPSGPPARCTSPAGLIVAVGLGETRGQVVSLICVNPRTGVGGQSSLFKVPDGQHVAVHDLSLHNPLLERSMFSPDLRKLAAWTTVRGAVHVGWFEKFGDFQDVSGPLERRWPSTLSPTTPQFEGSRYYFGLQSDHRIVEIVSVSVHTPTGGLHVEKRFTPSQSVNDFAVAPGGVISPFDRLRPRWLKLAGGFALSPSDLIGASGYVTRVAGQGAVVIARHALIPQISRSHPRGQSTPGTTLLSGAGFGDPVVSPDRRRYAFTRTEGDAVSLSIAPLHGGPATQVPTPQYGPSPFGRDAALIAWY